MPGCGFPVNLNPLTPPFVFSNWGISNPGTPTAFITIDSNDFFNNGLFDDSTTATGGAIVFASCGNPAPAVTVVSRNRITLAIPGLLTNCDVYIGLITTQTGPSPLYFKCGAPSGPPPTPACVLGNFPSQATTAAGCTVGSFPS
jgi:hypothetical protein